QFNSPVVKDGKLYGLTQGNELFCMDLQDGKTVWTAPAPAAQGGMGGPGGRGPGGPGGRGGMRGGGGRGGGYGSVVDAGSVLLALTPASELVVFKPGESYS